MKLNFKKLFLLFLPLFFLLPGFVQANEQIIDGSILYQYQPSATDGISFLKGPGVLNGIIYPKGATKIDKIYIFFHGLNPTTPPSDCDNCHLIDALIACNEFKLCQKVAIIQNLEPKQNIAILIPQMNPKSGNRASEFTKVKFDEYLTEALAQLRSKVADSPNTISVIAAHSAGANIINEYTKYFPPIDQALVFDGCYGNNDSWCKKIITNSNIKKKKIYVATTNNYDEINNAFIYNGAEGKIKKITAEHYQVPEKCFLDHITNDGCNAEEKKVREVDNLIADINKSKPTTKINFPGLNFSDIKAITDDTGTYIFIPWIPQFISTIYKFSVGAFSIVAVIIIILQGTRIIISGGSENKAEGYKKITHALIGLVIAWGSFAILYNINPNTVEFNALKVKVIEKQDLEVSPSDETEVEAGTIQTVGDKVPYFGQYEKPWNSMTQQPSFDINTCPINKKTGQKTPGTIQSRGCGPTSLAMVLKYLGKNVKPNDTGSLFLDTCALGMNTIKVQEKWKSSPWSDLKFDIFWGGQGESALAIAAQNYPIIMNCHPCVGYTEDGQLKNYAGHYMVITGSADGGKTFNINDPGGNPKIKHSIIKMTREQILTPPGIQSQIRKPHFIYIHQ